MLGEEIAREKKEQKRSSASKLETPVSLSDKIISIKMYNSLLLLICSSSSDDNIWPGRRCSLLELPHSV